MGYLVDVGLELQVRQPIGIFQIPPHVGPFFKVIFGYHADAHFLHKFCAVQLPVFLLVFVVFINFVRSRIFSTFWLNIDFVAKLENFVAEQRRPSVFLGSDEASSTFCTGAHNVITSKCNLGPTLLCRIDFLLEQAGYFRLEKRRFHRLPGRC